jgi:hypothetical protein
VILQARQQAFISAMIGDLGSYGGGPHFQRIILFSEYVYKFGNLSKTGAIVFNFQVQSPIFPPDSYPYMPGRRMFKSVVYQLLRYPIEVSLNSW